MEGTSASVWVENGLVIAGGVLTLGSFVSQCQKPAPYGKFDKEAGSSAGWGPGIPQRLGHIASDFIPGCIIFTLVYFLAAGADDRRDPTSDTPNIILLGFFLAHYLHRGLIHPLIMRYSSKTTPLMITVSGLIGNAIFAAAISLYLALNTYPNNYEEDARFVIGAVLFWIGYAINRWADLRLRNLRRDNPGQYVIPHGFLFDYVVNPNYFGELIEWTGFAIASWSIAAAVWALFGASTFILRSKENLKWYREKFGDEFPADRKALIPFVY